VSGLGDTGRVVFRLGGWMVVVRAAAWVCELSLVLSILIARV
jgi:hypothetical protein